MLIRLIYLLMVRVFGWLAGLAERHFRSVLTEYVRPYNDHRPHQALRQEPPLREPGHAVDTTAWTERRQVLGGLISDRRAA